MKSLVNRILVSLVITALTGVLAFAKSKKETVTFPDNINVSGTLVKKGTYEVAFNAETGELAIMKGKKVVAKAMARVEKRDAKARSLELRTSGTGDSSKLLALAFGGSSENIVVNQEGGQAAAKE